MARKEQAHREGDVEKCRTAEAVKEDLAAQGEAALHYGYDSQSDTDNQAGIDDDMGDRQARLAHQLVEGRRQPPEAAKDNEPEEMGGHCWGFDFLRQLGNCRIGLPLS